MNTESAQNDFVIKNNLRKLMLFDNFFVWLQYRGNRVYKVYGHEFKELPLSTITMSPLAFHLGNKKYRFLEMIYDFS